MTGKSEDNVFYFTLGMATGDALLWVLVRSIRMRL
jgi:hypothetical protein